MDGLLLKKLHRANKVTIKAWLKSYIDMITEEEPKTNVQKLISRKIF